MPHASRRRTRIPPTAIALVAAAWVGLFAAPLVAGDAAAEGREPSWRRTAAAVDALLEARLEAEHVAPAAPADDAEFLRRLYLDVVGTVPTAEEALAFLEDRSPAKRIVKIEELLASPSYADWWSMLWFKTLTGITGASLKGGNAQGLQLLRGVNGETFRAWLHEQFERNRPYDQFTSDLLSATGRTDENGATGYYARWQGKPNDLAGSVAKVFLGVRIQCCQCHDHVYEETWKQKDFQGMAAFFGTSFPQRVALKDDPDGIRAGRYAADVRDFDAPQRAGRDLARRAERRGREIPEELKQRLEIADVTPKFWMGPVAADVPGIPRRMLLARWVTSKENPYFARAIVNRMWGHFLGRGFVDPVDDFSTFNTPSHPEALDLLAQDFVASGWDLRRLIRLIVNTRAYQRTSRWEGKTEPDAALCARAPVRPLTGEQTYFAVARASGIEGRLDRLGRAEGRRQQRTLFASFAFAFDDDEMTESEDFEGSIPQGLFLLNGRLLQGATSPGAGTLQRVLAAGKSESERVKWLWLAAYGREPAADETNRATAYVRSHGGEEGWSDLFWALLNSAEFMTNH